MRYTTGAAFRAALDHRLKNDAVDTGLGLVRLRKAVAFDRFLARLLAVAPGRWVLKGALALDFRLGSATRATKDIDLGRLDDEDAATADFIAGQALELGDFFSFAVQRTPALDDAADFSAVRYRVQAELAGRLFEEFPVDVGFSDPLGWRPDRVCGTELLAFAEIERVELPLLPLEQHVAEKLHAYTRAYGSGASPSSRPKDLVDIVLIRLGASLDGGALRAAAEATFAARALQSLPAALPRPPAEWVNSYANLADAVGLPTELEQGYQAAAALVDPILAGRARGRWDHRAVEWVDEAQSFTAAPRLAAPEPEGIVIGELQNVASEIQPIRVRTIHLTLRNNGGGRATLHRADATSSTHGPLTARPPRTIEPHGAATLELTLAAPVDQTVAPGDSFDVELDYRGDNALEQRLAFSALFHAPGRWEIQTVEESEQRR